VYVYVFKMEKLPLKLQANEVEEVKFVQLDELERELENPETAKKYVPQIYYPELIKMLKEEIAKQKP